MYNGIVEVSSLAGKIMLESGGEVYRVEEIINHVSRSLGAESCDCYATPTAIIISITGGDGQVYSAMRRITTRRVDLNKVDSVNRLSRSLAANALPIEDIRERLERIQNKKSYDIKVVILASCMATGAFAGVFGGTWRDWVCAFVAGGIIRLVATVLQRIRLNDFFINMSGGLISVLWGWLSIQTGLGRSWDIISISALMLMVPGMLLTNGVRDIAAGDIVSGTSRTIEAFFIAVALACGAGLGYTLLMQWGGVGL